MHGEGVPHGMRGDRFGNFANTVGFLALVLNRAPADVLARRIAGKKPVLRPFHSPPLSQDLQQPGGEHHVAVLHSLALLDPHDHALAVDGRHCKSDAFGDAQACSVAGGQDGTVLPAGDTGKVWGFFGAGMMSSKVQSFLRVTLYRKRSAETAIRIEPGANFFSVARY